MLAVIQYVYPPDLGPEDLGPEPLKEAVPLLAEQSKKQGMLKPRSQCCSSQPFQDL